MASQQPENNSIRVNNSLTYLKLKENSHSRTLKTIPDEESNSFLVGVTSTSQSEIFKVDYGPLNKKLSSSSLLCFPTTEDKRINDIYGIYPINKTNFFVQCFNLSKPQYELNLCQYNQTSSQYEIIEIPSAHSESLFDINQYENDSSIINFISNCQVESVDLNSKSIIGVIPLYEKATNPIKICSDNPPAEPTTLAVGENNDIFICDLKSQKIATHIQNCHSNSILSIHYEIETKNVICSTGTDCSIKYWDIRKPDCYLGGLDNNTHWVWECKINKNYPNLLVTASSSSIVRNIIFNKKEENENEINRFTKDLKDFCVIEYCEFEDSVYGIDWSLNDSMTFAAVSFNSYFHMNKIPDNVKYKIMM